MEYIALVVYRPFPTSNHNVSYKNSAKSALYIVRFLHQTTTIRTHRRSNRELYIVRFLHQTTTMTIYKIFPERCISSVSYIKPQLRILGDSFSRVVYRPFPTSNHNPRLLVNLNCLVVYRPFPTSNHNFPNKNTAQFALYIVRFLHQTTTFCLSIARKS